MGIQSDASVFQNSLHSVNPFFPKEQMPRVVGFNNPAIPNAPDALSVPVTIGPVVNLYQKESTFDRAKQRYPSKAPTVHPHRGTGEQNALSKQPWHQHNRNMMALAVSNLSTSIRQTPLSGARSLAPALQPITLPG